MCSRPTSSDSDLQNEVAAFAISTELARIPVVLVKDGTEGSKVIFANQSFLAMSGLSDADVLGRPIISVLGEMTDRVTLAKVEMSMREQRPTIWEMQCHRRDGSAIFVSVLATSVCSEENTHLQTCLSFYLLDEGFERLLNIPGDVRTIYEKTPGFIAAARGAEHRFTFANESYKKFVGIDDLEGRTVAEAMPQIAAQGFVALLDRVFQTGEPFRGENVQFQLVDDRGQDIRRYADFIYQPIRDERRKIVGIFCEGYDVTERHVAELEVKALQAELFHASRINAMGTMATTLAHELNQPLSAITNYTAACLRLIEAGAPSEKAFSEAVGAIHKTSQRAGNIIKSLRNLASRREPNREQFDIKCVLEDSLNLVRSAMSPDIKVTLTIAEGIQIYADQVQIQQVVVNLLRNACDAVYGADVQEIWISASASEAEVEISIRDSGTGVSAAAGQNIFTWTESTKEGGMGLGLSICRTIVESHHGRIWLEETSDYGAAFHFTLPLVAPFPNDNRRSGS